MNSLIVLLTSCIVLSSETVSLTRVFVAKCLLAHPLSFGWVAADVGDEFVVDMFLDEKYGTVRQCLAELKVLPCSPPYHSFQFVFNTVGGQSKCPHEVNTNPIELPNLSLETAVGITPVDESMIFKVGLNNEVSLLLCCALGVFEND